jgi:hypothetical protein
MTAIKSYLQSLAKDHMQLMFGADAVAVSCKEKVRVIRTANRITKAIFSDRFCV